MALVTWRRPVAPWNELRHLQGEMGRLMDEMWSGGRGSEEGTLWSPPVDVEETGDALVVTAELPGVRRDDVEIEFDDGVLTLRGQKQSEREEGDTRRHVWERCYGSFSRSFTLPSTVNPDGIKASFKDGVLRVSVPKAEHAKGRRIEITAGEEGSEVDVQ